MQMKIKPCTKWCCSRSVVEGIGLVKIGCVRKESRREEKGKEEGNAAVLEITLTCALTNQVVVVWSMISMKSLMLLVHRSYDCMTRQWYA